MDFDSGSFRFIVYTDTTFKAIKLEFGTVSTLGMDTAPNYATELLKCQRYFFRYPYRVRYFYPVPAGNVTVMDVDFPCTMRTYPVISNIAGSSDVGNMSINVSVNGVHFQTDTPTVQSYITDFDASADL